MRDSSLYFLFSSVLHLKGVGQGTAQALSRLLPSATALSGANLPIIRDILFHLPVNVVDRRFTCPIVQAPDKRVATFVVKIDAHIPPPPGRMRGKKPYKVLCSNETGSMMLVFFHASAEHLQKQLPIGQRRVVSGITEHFDFRLQMTHPDIIAPVESLAQVMRVEPVYPLTLGLSNRRLYAIVEQALAKLPSLPEWITPAMLQAHGWPDWQAALRQAHHPEDAGDLLPEHPARLRLAYDEMLAGQLHLALLRRAMQQQLAEVIQGTGILTGKLQPILPFALTQGQQRVLQEIYGDMASGKRMARLLQGDVGSGKTVVALFAMLRAVEQGRQAALMVPTELIAQQHYETLNKLVAGDNNTLHSPLSTLHITLLTGSIKGKAREQALAAIASGEAQIVIGTHALFQEQVQFHALSLVVIDEQHRFGVNQRMALTAKGEAPHLLHMTATPIPRSLTMTMYGDMDCSMLTEKPAGRQPIATRVIALSRYEEVMARLQAALGRGEKAYWICPLIEGSEFGVQSAEGLNSELSLDTDIAAANARHTEFKARFGNVVGLVHGRMKADERQREMQRFAQGETRLLVATTVVEVGVDVKDATIIVIEQAERFGLSQLHQLRGRVGRGDKPSACVLLCADRLGEEGLARLSILRESEDGFRIAEADLAIRGGGELLGTRQSGLQRFIFTDLAAHQALLQQAHEDVQYVLAQDAALASERGEALKRLLQLFSYNGPGSVSSASEAVAAAVSNGLS